MRAKEIIQEDISYKPFLEQLDDIRDEARKEFVIARLTQERWPDQADVYYKYMSKILKAIDEAIASGKNPAARRIMRNAIPNNQDLRDAVAKDRATPSKQMWGTGAARQTERRRRAMWLKGIRFGMKVRKMLNFDTKLDKPPRDKEELLTLIQDLTQKFTDAKEAGKPVPYGLNRMLWTAKAELKRHGIES